MDITEWHEGLLLAGFVALTAIAPAHAQTTGGVSITHGGGNVNVARGAFSEGDQSASSAGRRLVAARQSPMAG
jgi:hypothetical protein